MVPSNGSGGCNLTPAGNPPVVMVVVVTAADILAVTAAGTAAAMAYSVTSYRYAAWSSASKSYT